MYHFNAPLINVFTYLYDNIYDNMSIFFPIIIYPASSTVYYGTRTLIREVFIIPDNEYNGPYGVYQSVNDTCPSNVTQCDGIKDCQLGTDETYCGEYADKDVTSMTLVEAGYKMAGALLNAN